MTEVVKDELTLLREQADILGVPYTEKTTKTALKKAVAEKLTQQDSEDITNTVRELENENLKLVRVIITPNDNLKRDYPGEYFSVGNSVISTISRYVPYNTEWHIENMLLKMLKEKQYQQFTTRKVGDKEIVETKQLPAYTIQEIPPLTKEELEELKQRQLARKGV